MERPGPMPHQKLVKMDAELNRRLSDYRFANRFKSEAAAIRELMRLGFAALEEGGTFAT
jgi:hypothetical protein